MQLEFLKYFWTSSSGSPKFARVARKNSAWLRPQGCLSRLRNKQKEHILVWFRMFPADLTKRRRQNNIKRIINNILCICGRARNSECCKMLMLGTVSAPRWAVRPAYFLQAAVHVAQWSSCVLAGTRVDASCSQLLSAEVRNRQWFVLLSGLSGLDSGLCLGSVVARLNDG